MKLTLPYIAGFFDGEGCVNMARCRTVIFPRVLIVNTDRRILNALRARFGGDINSIIHRQPIWKSSWSWRLSGTAAVDFLTDILPWLVIKRNQAITAMAWDGARPGRGNRWDRESINFLTQEMKWLNQKGPRLGKEEPLKQVLREIKTGQSEMAI